MDEVAALKGKAARQFPGRMQKSSCQGNLGGAATRAAPGARLHHHPHLAKEEIGLKKSRVRKFLCCPETATYSHALNVKLPETRREKNTS